MSKFFVSIAFLFLGFFQLPAETIFVADGRIFLGNLISAASGKIEMESYGQSITLNAGEVLKTEANFASLMETKVEVVLKDSSTIRGKIVDFDADIGLFLDIEFGILTLPLSSISNIYDPVAREIYEGALGSAFIGGTYNIPLVLTGYDPGFTVLLQGEWKTPFLRGLYLGASLEYNSLKYTLLEQLQYSITHLTAEATYKYLGFRSDKGVLFYLSPFITLGAGPSVILVADNRPNIFPNTYGTLVGHVNGRLGVELGPWSGVIVRVFGGSTLTFQSNGLFTTMETGILVGYSFNKVSK